jgi:Cu-Zn family superoxide dismutase
MRPLGFTFALLSLAVLAGCDNNDDGDRRTATATISAPVDTTTGVTGTVTFTPVGDGFRVEADLQGLSQGEHGFHLHANGSCARGDHDSDDFAEVAGAAGGHYDPLNTNDHGAPDDDDDEKHLGDFGNVTAGSDGRATQTLTIDGLSSVSGRAVIVHSGRDDLETDPAGNSGDRIGCGVVTED